jgi:hypothetical protein
LKAKRQKRDVSARASVPKMYYVRKQLLQPGLQFLESIATEKRSFSLNLSSWKAICQKRDPSARASVPGKHFVRKRFFSQGFSS